MSYKPNSLIAVASAHMENYRMPNGIVDIQPEDTGVIVLIIFYFLKKEPSISRTKMEAYMLILDRMCFEKCKTPLFGWTLQRGRIRNFREIINFMIAKKLILQENKRKYVLQELGKEVSELSYMLTHIEYWLKEILTDYKYKTAQQTLSDAKHCQTQ